MQFQETTAVLYLNTSLSSYLQSQNTSMSSYLQSQHHIQNQDLMKVLSQGTIMNMISIAKFLSQGTIMNMKSIAKLLSQGTIMNMMVLHKVQEYDDTTIKNMILQSRI